MDAGNRINPGWMKGRISIAVATVAVCLVAVCQVVPAWGDEGEEFFEKKVRPILAGKCFRCHGDQKTGGELRTDTRGALIQGGDSGPAVIPGKPEESLLLEAVRSEEGVSAMPPDQALTPEEIRALEEWIRQGAMWPVVTKPFETSKHWAFEPIKDVPPSEIQQKDWPLTSIDGYILNALEKEGLKPAARADRRTLIRRVTYDLTGLPPTPEEVEAYLADTRSEAEAYKGVVERLLASPRYGEHWGRHWLDIVRYADTAGENSDHPLPHAWKYRNWVIQAINKDQPYDQFLRDQIAGDLLPKDVPREMVTDRIVATGYLAIARRFGHDIDKDMH
ncbi:MAG: DUF1549 domain-containing protein, partial [Planctomycetaceae bacterium]|nr:DUF1549 domain-containing protein [Planctomycetaceae bacterium]